MSPLPKSPPRTRYPSELTDPQWELVEPFVRGNPVGPQPVVHSRREVVNPLLYVSVKSRLVCSWFEGGAGEEGSLEASFNDVWV